MENCGCQLSSGTLSDSSGPHHPLPFYLNVHSRKHLWIILLIYTECVSSFAVEIVPH